MCVLCDSSFVNCNTFDCSVRVRIMIIYHSLRMHTSEILDYTQKTSQSLPKSSKTNTVNNFNDYIYIAPICYGLASEWSLQHHHRNRDLRRHSSYDGRWSVQFSRIFHRGTREKKYEHDRHHELGPE